MTTSMLATEPHLVDPVAVATTSSIGVLSAHMGGGFKPRMYFNFSDFLANLGSISSFQKSMFSIQRFRYSQMEATRCY